ncbi:MAG: hypothetical protein N3A53_08140, partial [Verrucomicrobiae bacterium]|nr:hypothetical protein [Verrucomicrobiae bacterium]
MKTLRPMLCALAMLVVAATAWATVTNGPVYVLVLHEDITHNTLFLVRRGLREAAAKQAALVVLDMETNG